MSDLISREALLEVLRGLKPSGFEQSFAGQVAIRCIEAAPAVDAEPVRHGRWGEYEFFPLSPSLNGYPCSNCGQHVDRKTCYCPNCGAKMDEEEET